MLTYEEWTKVPEAEKLTLPESEYPEIPPEKLENSLTRAVAEKMDGVMGWRLTQMFRGESRTKWFPEFKQKKIGSQMIWYILNPFTGTYRPNTESEPEEDEPMGGYGMSWMNFIERNYPEYADLLRFEERYLTEAMSVDKSAWEYREILEREFAGMYPEPEEYNARLEWLQARQRYAESLVMREVVLVPPYLTPDETEEE